MSNYKRFIMYLFRYENGSKMENCGFAKVECRQNVGRMQLHLDLNANIQREEACRICFFAKEKDHEERQQIIFLGGLGAHETDATLTFACKKVGDSLCSFDEVRGLVIPLSDTSVIASQWDDAAYDWRQLAYQAYREQKHIEDDSVKGSVDMDESREDMHEGTVSIEGLKKERIAMGKDPGELCVETMCTEKGLNRTEQYSEPPRQGKPMDGSSDRELPKTSELEIQSVSGAAARRSCLVEDSATEYPMQRNHEKENTKPQNMDQRKEGPSVIKWQEDVSKMGDSDWLQDMESVYPRVYPFAGDKRVWGMQVQLKDLKYLPKQYQGLGNNSFLLHGYFTYGTILIGFMEEQQKWFLGVPGIFQNQERVLAALFGFPEFRTRQECVQKTGEFGYWYRYLV